VPYGFDLILEKIALIS